MIDTQITTPLSTEERDALQSAETIIRRGQQTFIEVGLALAEIRDRRLYRENYPSLEAYLHDRYPDMTRRHAYRIMDAAETASVVSHGTQLPVPTSERVIRALTPLPTDQAREVYAQAVAAAGGAVPTSKLVEATIKKHAEWTCGSCGRLYTGPKTQSGRCTDCTTCRCGKPLPKGVSASGLCTDCAMIVDQLAAQARTKGYTIKAHGTGWRICRGESPLGGAKTITELRDVIRSYEDEKKCGHCRVTGMEMLDGHCIACHYLLSAQTELQKGGGCGWGVWRLKEAARHAANLPQPNRSGVEAEIQAVAAAYQITTKEEEDEEEATTKLLSVQPPAPLDVDDLASEWSDMVCRLSDREQRMLYILLGKPIISGDVTEELCDEGIQSLASLSHLAVAWITG